jgi:hypothetical protein
MIVDFFAVKIWIIKCFFVILSGSRGEILGDKLEPIPFKHPVADIKYDALSWCFKHEMWHSAEMEDIKMRLGHQIKWLRD